jgi:thiamine pyrophosphate-dependent acetolactate synthase large subunit-like protein
MIDGDRLKSFAPPEEHKKNKSVKEEIIKIIEILNSSERPVILAGNGIRLAKGEEDLSGS